MEQRLTVVKGTFGSSNELSLQYLDSEFKNYFTLNRIDQIEHTIKVVYAALILLNLFPIHESLDSSSGQSIDSVCILFRVNYMM